MPGLLLLWWQRKVQLDAVTPLVASSQRQVAKPLAATSATTAVLQAQFVKIVTLAASSAFGTGVVRATGKLVIGTTALGAAFQRLTNKGLTVTASFAAVMQRVTSKTMTSALPCSVTLSKGFTRTLGAVTICTGALAPSFVTVPKPRDFFWTSYDVAYSRRRWR